MNKNLVKILPLGGQAEMGKSMYCIEIDDKILIIDSGIRFPEVSKLGVDIIIPDLNYISKNKDKIVGIIITHGHDDVMAALPYVLEEINVPIYTPTLTGHFIRQMLDRFAKQYNKKANYKVINVSRVGSADIKGIHVEFFPVTHSIPGAIGVAIETKSGYIVYASEGLVDLSAPLGFGLDMTKMMKIGNKGILALMVESSYSKNEGYTSPKHKLTSQIEHTFEEAEGRIIITSYAQNVFRTREIIELCRKYRRKLVFYGRDNYDTTNTILRINNKLKPQILVKLKDVVVDKSHIKTDDNIVVLLTGAPHRIYHDLVDLVDGGDELLKFTKEDSVVVASPVIPGTEKIATKAQNELFKTPANIKILKNKQLPSMHASKEDIKFLIQLFKPKYYIPIKGEYQHLIENRNVALSMGIEDKRIVIIDNGEQITFEDNHLASYRDTIDVPDVMIDGIGIGDVGEKVIDDRIQLSSDGVVIIGITVDAKTRKIIANTDIQTRGFIYLRDSVHVINAMMDISNKTMEKYENKADVEVNTIRGQIKDKVGKYISKETGKRPVILPIIIEI